MEVLALTSEKSGFLSEGELLQSRNMVGTCLSKQKCSGPLLPLQLVACLAPAEFPIVAL